jgi:CheY-like chemotaxis protein
VSRETRRLGHELRNVLTAVVGNLQILRDRLGEAAGGRGDAELIALVAEAQKACARAIDLSRQVPSDVKEGTAGAAGDEAGSMALSAGPGEGTILLCEDADSIRRSTRMILRGQGYAVLDAASAAAARATAAEHPGEIDLLLADVELTDGDGTELAAELAAARPGLRVLYVSGHAERSVERPPGAPTGEFLEKPFSSDTLLRKVREILSARG